MIVLVAGTALALGVALFGYASMRARVREISARLADRDQELVRTRQEHAQAEALQREEHAAEERHLREEHAEAVRALDREAQQLRTALSEAREGRATLAAQLQNEKANAAQLEGRFAALSRDALAQSTQQLAQLADQVMKRAQDASRADSEKRELAVAELVKPVRESLQKVDEKIGKLEKSSEVASGQLAERIKTVAESSDRLRTEAARLVTALRAPAQRGRWGEQQLRNTIELAGLRDHVDFLEQPVVQTAEGTLRPDIAVRLPGNKTVLIDSKVPFDAFGRAVEADDRDRPALLQKHCEQLRAHIGQLSKKQYWQAFSDSPEMIVLFLPGEGFLGAALDCDPLLHEEAFKSRVVLATPATLLALLLTVAHVWKQESIALNAREIANLGRDLHKRIGDLAGHFARLGRSLDGAVDTYNKAIGSFERRLIPAARRFEDLKAAAVDVQVEALPGLEVRPRLPAALLESVPDDAN